MESKGIEADLPQSNLEAVIPEEQKVLLEVNSDRYGIHQQMEKLLTEINSDDVDWAQTLENLHSRAMSDFSYLQQSQTRGRFGACPDPHRVVDHPQHYLPDDS